jgi:hypothetical protein
MRFRRASSFAVASLSSRRLSLLVRSPKSPAELGTALVNARVGKEPRLLSQLRESEVDARWLRSFDGASNALSKGWLLCAWRGKYGPLGGCKKSAAVGHGLGGIRPCESSEGSLGGSEDCSGGAKSTVSTSRVEAPTPARNVRNFIRT